MQVRQKPQATQKVSEDSHADANGSQGCNNEDSINSIKQKGRDVVVVLRFIVSCQKGRGRRNGKKEGGQVSSSTKFNVRLTQSSFVFVLSLTNNIPRKKNWKAKKNRRKKKMRGKGPSFKLGPKGHSEIHP